LIQECLAGKGWAQQQLYRTHAPRMLGLCYRYAQSQEEAEDILQEGFIKVFVHLKKYRGNGPVGAWIRKIMVNTALNHIKTRHRFAESIEKMTVEENALLAIDDYELKEIIEEIRQLSTGFRTVFNLYAIEGYSHKEISVMLGISEGTSRSQYSRARSILMKRLSRNGGES
jgi:RNA polymerase sigma factor (sigma-70 family)